MRARPPDGRFLLHHNLAIRNGDPVGVRDHELTLLPEVSDVTRKPDNFVSPAVAYQWASPAC